MAKILYWDNDLGEAIERDMTPDELAAWQAELTAPKPIPQSVTMKQARLALFQGGYLASVDTAIQNMQEPQKTEANIQWNYSQTVERQNPFCDLLGAAIGLNSSQIDDLFRTAAGL